MIVTAVIDDRRRVTLDLALAAEWFTAISDDDQAKFFVEVSKKAADTFKGGNWGASQQWFYVGRHLRDCECSTEEARDMIRMIYEAMEKKP